MKDRTKQQLIALYYNWTKPRDDYGLPLSLADHLIHWRQTKGNPQLATLALSQGLFRPSYVEALDKALDEGVTDEELKELSGVRVKQRHPGDRVADKSYRDATGHEPPTPRAR